jgi:archaellum component FlaC
MIELAEKRAEKVLERLEGLVEKIPEAKKLVALLKEQIPTFGERVAKGICAIREALPKLENVVKALENKETVIKCSFNKLSITIDGEKTFSITLLKPAEK